MLNNFALLVLRRSENDGIGFEDVDTLQLELEALLSATVVRKFTLKDESKVISNIEKYKSGGKLYKKVILKNYQAPYEIVSPFPFHHFATYL